jgi:hypothetical protein
VERKFITTDNGKYTKKIEERSGHGKKKIFKVPYLDVFHACFRERFGVN